MEELTRLLPTYNQTSLKILDYVRNNPGALFIHISDSLSSEGKTNAQIRGHLVILLREGMLFSDLVGPRRLGRPTAEYYLTLKAEEMFEDNDIYYEV